MYYVIKQGKISILPEICPCSETGLPEVASLYISEQARSMKD